MQFLTPGILWGLLALSIPIIIHLFYFRRFRKVYFSNTRFLKEVKEQTRNRSKLRNLLVLICRLLAFAFIILAFAQPFIPADKDAWQGARAVSIFVDNSFSMQGRGKDVSLLEEAKARARDIVNAYGDQHTYQLLTHEFEGRHQRLVGKDEILEEIDEIEISPRSSSLEEITDRQMQVLGEVDARRRSRVIISDFQRVMLGENLNVDSLEQLRFMPLNAVAEDNIAIDSVWFDQPVRLPGQTVNMYIRLKNYGEVERTDARLAFNYAGQSRPAGTVNIDPGGSAIDSFSFNPVSEGWQTAEVSVEDYPISFDDSWYLSFNVEDALKVLSLGGESPNDYLTALFKNLSNAELDHRSLQNIQYTRFPNYNLIVLVEPDELSSGLIGQLQAYVESGGNLLFFPAAGGDLADYNELLGSMNAGAFGNPEEQEMMVGKINTGEFVFRDVFESVDRNMALPRVRLYYPLNPAGGHEELLSFRNGRSFLSKYSPGEGRFYLSSSPLSTEYSDLIRQGEIFVPMVFRMALASGGSRDIAYVIGRDQTLSIPMYELGNDPVFEVKGPVNFIPAVSSAGQRNLIDMTGQLAEAGHYSVEARDSTLFVASYNYDRAESLMEFADPAALSESYPAATIYGAKERERLASLIQSETEGRQLWYLCIIFALVFLLLEQLILRFIK